MTDLTTRVFALNMAATTMPRPERRRGSIFGGLVGVFIIFAMGFAMGLVF